MTVTAVELHFYRPNAKRRYKNQKFGFGGKKKGSKWNTRESHDDVSSFRAKTAHGKGLKRPGKKGSNVSEPCGPGQGPAEAPSSSHSSPLCLRTLQHKVTGCMIRCAVSFSAEETRKENKREDEEQNTLNSFLDREPRRRHEDVDFHDIMGSLLFLFIKNVFNKEKILKNIYPWLKTQD